MKIMTWNPTSKRFRAKHFEADMDLTFIHAVVVPERQPGATIDFTHDKRRTSINLSVEETIKLRDWITKELKSGGHQ